MLAAATCVVAAAAGVSSRCAAAIQPTFYMGGDISMLPFLEGRGATCRDDGLVRGPGRLWSMTAPISFACAWLRYRGRADNSLVPDFRRDSCVKSNNGNSNDTRC
jgi:hypothetical protein